MSNKFSFKSPCCFEFSETTLVLLQPVSQSGHSTRFQNCFESCSALELLLSYPRFITNSVFYPLHVDFISIETKYAACSRHVICVSDAYLPRASGTPQHSTLEGTPPR
jgi:hypothetical protein